MFDSSIIYGHFYFAIAAVLDNNNGDIAADMKECILNVQPLCDCRNEFLQRTYIFYQPFDMFVLHAFATTKGLFYVSRWPWIICVCVFLLLLLFGLYTQCMCQLVPGGVWMSDAFSTAFFVLLSRGQQRKTKPRASDNYHEYSWEFGCDVGRSIDSRRRFRNTADNRLSAVNMKYRDGVRMRTQGAARIVRRTEINETKQREIKMCVHR